MAVVVDVEEEVKLPLGQVRLGAREAHVARLVGKAADGGRQSCAIARLERAHLHDAAVVQRQAWRMAPRGVTFFRHGCAGADVVKGTRWRVGRVRQASSATRSAIAATALPKISKVDCREMCVTSTPARTAGTDSDP